jgi:hypothetical protein
MSTDRESRKPPASDPGAHHNNWMVGPTSKLYLGWVRETLSCVADCGITANPSSATHSTEPNTRIPTRSAEDSPKKSFFSRLRGPHLSSNTQDELKRYFQMTSTPLPFENTDLLGWWYANRAVFPNLYKMARDIHCIPGAPFQHYFSFLLGIDTCPRICSRSGAGLLRRPRHYRPSSSSLTAQHHPYFDVTQGTAPTCTQGGPQCIR